MIAVAIKDCCRTSDEQLNKRVNALPPFYRDYVLQNGSIGVQGVNGAYDGTNGTNGAQGANDTQTANGTQDTQGVSPTRLACCELLLGFCKQYFAEVPNFEKTETGKPYFRDTGVAFSFSHSKNVALCAVSFDRLDACRAVAECECLFGARVFDFACHGELSLGCGECVVLTVDECAHKLGADVQIMPPHSEKAPLLTLHAKVARRFFDERTLAALEENKTEEEFYRLFSVAESLSKLSGAGLANYRKGDIDAKTLSSRLLSNDGEYALALAFAK